MFENILRIYVDDILKKYSENFVFKNYGTDYFDKAQVSLSLNYKEKNLSCFLYSNNLKINYLCEFKFKLLHSISTFEVDKGLEK